MLYKVYFPSLIYYELLFLREGNANYRYNIINTFLEVFLLVKHGEEMSKLAAMETRGPSTMADYNTERSENRLVSWRYGSENNNSSSLLRKM